MTQNTEYDTDLISIVAHDLKAPISAARGFLDLVEATGPMTDQQQQFFNRAMMALDRMEGLVTSLLDFSKVDATLIVEPVEVDLYETIQDAIDLHKGIAQQQEISVQLSGAMQTFLVMADKRLISHVMNNLISNALKYNKNGGAVWVRIRELTSEVQIDVQDNGLGIPDKDVPRVFERFYRSRVHKDMRITGSGLGLAICKAIVDKHNGKIWVVSEENKGSTFSFTLPGRPAKKHDVTTPTASGEQLDGIDDRDQDIDDSSDLESRRDAP